MIVIALVPEFFQVNVLGINLEPDVSHDLFIFVFQLDMVFNLILETVFEDCMGKD